ncbi:MAG TPA: hypothetical protein PLV45_15915, partial [bacterium]|nr:hypothetical protein [bacterium]
LRGSISCLSLRNVQIPFITTFDYSGALPVDTLNFHASHSLKPVKVIGDISHRVQLKLQLPFASYRYRFTRKDEHVIESTIGATQCTALDASGWWRVCEFKAPSFSIVNQLDKTLSVSSNCPWLHFAGVLPGRCRKTIHVLPDKLQRGLNRAMLRLSGNDFEHTLLIDLHGVLPEPGIRFANPASDVGSVDIGSNAVCKIEMIMEGAGVCNGILFCPQIGLVRNIQMENHGPSENRIESFLISVDTSSVRAGQNELVFYFISNTTRLDLRFQSHKVQFNSRHLILDPEIIVYDTKKKRFIPDMLHVSCSDDSEISTTVTVHSSIRSKIAVEKITDNTFRLTPLKGLLELSGFKGIEIMTVHVENSDGTLNRNLRVIVNE